LSKHFFKGEENFIRFHMNEYMEKHSVSGLTGVIAGYEGHDQGGRLTEQVLQNRS
jgi:ATP-dependent Clp protease ATP-binding subunit ClpA